MTSPIIIQEVTIISGRKGKRGKGTGQSISSRVDQDYTNVFRQKSAADIIRAKKQAQRDAWNIVKPFMPHVTDKGLGQILGLSPKTIRRYRNGGAGYENGPPIDFINRCKYLFRL